MTNNYQVRPALPQDQQEIANLMFFERRVHRHLDWKNPTEWLGSPFYWVLEENSRIIAVLACPQDQKEITWLRLFTHTENFSTEKAWGVLWENAKEDLEKYGKIKISAITVQSWMQTLLKDSGFTNDEQILIMSWTGEKKPELTLPKGINIRAMTEADLPKVAQVDEAAFAPLWQNPLSMLKQAYSQAINATIAESADGIIGYQISTPIPFGAHLARLAIHPQTQRRGVASALISDLIGQLLAKEIAQLSVNTQSKNERSIALYTKNGFKRTDEEYPLYSFQISGNEQKKEIQWDTVKTL
ncbi:MAG: GNAT family N-acetyltransferase [Anaerolineae bacterium]|nr:GNAT family N-acetyltransferase [Anaerolineae bacterium]